jgi:hypothetical protein
VLLFRLVDKNIRALSVIALAGSIMWSGSAGYIRYGLFLELLAGVMVFYFFSWISSEQLGLPRPMKPILLLLPWCVMGAQSLVSCRLAYKHEWSERPTVFNHFEAYIRDSKNVLGDYALDRFLSPATRELVGEVEVWLESSPQTSGIEALLKRNIPLVYLRGYYEAYEGRAEFAKAIEDVRTKKTASLCFVDDLKTSGEIISSRGLAMGRITPIEIPYYSHNAVFRMALIDVLPAGSEKADESVSSTEGPLPEQAYKASITAPGMAAILVAGSRETLYVDVKNMSDVTWPARSSTRSEYQIMLRNHWLNGSDQVVINDDGVAPLLYEVKPGCEILLPLIITAPSFPGNYVLEIDMSREGVVWFNHKGSNALRLSVKVE